MCIHPIYTSVFLPGESHEQWSLVGYTVHRVAQRWTWLKKFSTHICLYFKNQVSLEQYLSQTPDPQLHNKCGVHLILQVPGIGIGSRSDVLQPLGQSWSLKTGKPGMTVQGSFLEQLKRESLALLGFLGCEDVSQEILKVTNGNLGRNMTQSTEEPRDGKK